MVNVFLYCSYSGSAVGYQKAVVDESKKIVRRPREGEIPKLISQIWTHGGASAAAGYVGGSAYFLVKRMDYQNESKQRDEQGRKVFMNCAFTGSSREELQQLADGFLACYQAAVQKLGDLLVVDESEIGYTIQNFNGLHELIASCVEAGKRSYPSRVGTLMSSIDFIALEGDWNYFTKQNNVPTVPRPKKMMEANDYQRMLSESQKDFSLKEPKTPPPKRPDVPPLPETKERSIAAAAVSTVVKGGEINKVEEKPKTESKHTTQHTDIAALWGELTRIERKVEQGGRWSKAALALAAVAVLLVLILRGCGGAQ